MQNQNIFIIIPAYNEEDNIFELLLNIENLSNRLLIRVILIDDGSTDRTLKIARNFANQLNLKIIIHQPNLGIPKTFFDGFKAAADEAGDKDIIIMIEGDGTSDLNLIPSMVEKIKSGCQLVVASRYIKGGCYKNFPRQRTLGSKIINFILKAFFRIRGLTDYTIFYRAYQAEIIKQALSKYRDNFITTKSFAANLEVLLKVEEFITRIGEVPLVYNYGLKKSKSKMKLFKTLWEYKDLILKKILGGL